MVLSPLRAMRTGQPAGPARRCQLPSEAPPSPVAGFLFPVAAGAMSILTPRPVPQTNAAAWLKWPTSYSSDHPSPLRHRLSSMWVNRPAQFCFLWVLFRPGLHMFSNSPAFIYYLKANLGYPVSQVVRLEWQGRMSTPGFAVGRLEAKSRSSSLNPCLFLWLWGWS